MDAIVDLGCCNTLAMSDMCSPFLNRSTATLFKSGDISFSFHPMIFDIQKHTQTRGRRHCYVCSDVTTHYFINRNHVFPLTLKHVSTIGVSLMAICIFHITDAIFDEYFWPLTVCEVVYGYHPTIFSYSAVKHSSDGTISLNTISAWIIRLSSSGLCFDTKK